MGSGSTTGPSARGLPRAHGLEGGTVDASTPVIEESLTNIGATIMGRNMFGGHPGPWDPARPWNGWWGANPPFHHPVFVLTHHPRVPLRMEGGTVFTFVTDGIEAALEQARRPRAGATHPQRRRCVARQYLTAGMIDEMELHLVPMLLGAGERLFEGVADLGDLQLVRTVAAPNVTHLRFARG